MRASASGNPRKRRDVNQKRIHTVSSTTNLDSAARASSFGLNAVNQVCLGHDCRRRPRWCRRSDHDPYRAVDALAKLRMRFISTRDPLRRPHTFRQCLFGGLADDSGMFLPESAPVVTADMLRSWVGLSFGDLALEVLSLFIDTDEIPRTELAGIIAKSFK